jgi:hypothetical protein
MASGIGQESFAKSLFSRTAAGAFSAELVFIRALIF